MGKVYQKGRILSQSLAGLKVIMNELGLCGTAVLPPLYETGPEETKQIKQEMARLEIPKHSGI